MTSVLQFQDMTPSLTPPPSDRGECDTDTAMLNSDAYLPEVFYPSPAPSFSHQRRGFTPQSPDMCQSDTAYDTEEDSQQLFFLNSSEAQMFSSTASAQNAALYPTSMPYQSYDLNSWLPYGTYSSQPSMFPYSSEEASSTMYGYMSPAPTSIIPPTPQGVTGASFNFNESITRPQDTSNFLTAYPPQGLRHPSPAAPSTISASGLSSRSCSPNLSLQAVPESQNGRRPSMIPHRSSSSSLHAYGIPIRTPDSTTVQAWRCAYPNCTSRAIFTRGCDLRKHYNRHSKHLFCRVDGCPQSEAACIVVAQQQAIQAGSDASDLSKLAILGGFSSKKDRARHEAKHNPGIKCEWRGPNGEECGRLFSRMDNMKDHVRRIHNKGQPQIQQHQLPPKAISGQ
ncbi:hypothetical protein H2198_005777 [Neophaeococcomyces mojaviensis]|uniref:Uncharacterized protein n=1 Tax=Neophaeococcomyces mojaviensis TaxID=3383035 RepID=A0ACC3A4N0_9EURO|nr:hypothetical protein H2198_005777 [Knufia sp. JES_112]